jgi:hypothetical protein
MTLAALNQQESGNAAGDRVVHNGPGLPGFPLLKLAAMLGTIDEKTLSRVINQETIAVPLLEHVRWAGGHRECPYSGAAFGADPPAHAHREACEKPYSVTTGTMFEVSNAALRCWAVVIHQLLSFTRSDLQRSIMPFPTSLYRIRPCQVVTLGRVTTIVL